jgi:hypothetical protein
MTQQNKFKDLNAHFVNLGTEIQNKFKNLNVRFVSLGTEMTK